jgi:hypothetical protein
LLAVVGHKVAWVLVVVVGFALSGALLLAEEAAVVPLTLLEAA